MYYSLNCHFGLANPTLSHNASPSELVLVSTIYEFECKNINLGTEWRVQSAPYLLALFKMVGKKSQKGSMFILSLTNE